MMMMMMMMIMMIMMMQYLMVKYKQNSLRSQEKLKALRATTELPKKKTIDVNHFPKIKTTAIHPRAEVNNLVF